MLRIVSGVLSPIGLLFIFSTPDDIGGHWQNALTSPVFTAMIIPAWFILRKTFREQEVIALVIAGKKNREIEEAFGVTVIYASCQLEGDPGWSYPDSSPVLDAPPRLVRAWEHGAGKVRPKPRPRPRVIDPADLPVEPDLSRPVRDYAISGSFDSGDRINHPTLGLGVVQGGAGNGKIYVLFGEKKSLLIHQRAGSTGPVGSSPLSGAPD